MYQLYCRSCFGGISDSPTSCIAERGRSFTAFSLCLLFLSISNTNVQSPEGRCYTTVHRVEICRSELALGVIRFQVLLQIRCQEVAGPFLAELLQHVFLCNVNLVCADPRQLGNLLGFLFKDGLDRCGIELLARVLEERRNKTSD